MDLSHLCRWVKLPGSLTEVIAKQKESFIVKPNNLAGIDVFPVAISSVSFILLPVGLELGIEITQRRGEHGHPLEWREHRERHMIDWCDLFLPRDHSPCMPDRPCAVPVMNTHCEGPDADPPLNMKWALIFSAAFILELRCFPFRSLARRRGGSWMRRRMPLLCNRRTYNKHEVPQDELCTPLTLSC